MPSKLRRQSLPSRPRLSAWLGALLLVFGLGLVNATVQADSYDERRVRTGAKFFRALLAADLKLTEKAAGDGSVAVWVYARRDQDIRAVLGAIAPGAAGAQPTIRGVWVAASAIEQLPRDDAAAPVGIFLATPMSDADFARLLQWSIDRHVIVYSPFEGDVERGAAAGMVIEAKVLPYVNLTTLEKSGIELGSFFLNVAKVTR